MKTTPHTRPQPISSTAWRSSLLCALLCAAGSTSWAQGQSTITLKAAQITSLGVKSALATSNDGGSNGAPTAAGTNYPAQVLVPTTQQRVIAAPAAGLIEALAVSDGDAVKPGQWLVRLRSPQAQELARDVLQAESQLELARVNLQRDEALLKDGMVATSRVDMSRAQWIEAQAQAKERKLALSHVTGSTSPNTPGVLTLNAPIQGRVLEQMASVGQRVDAMTPIYKVATLNPMWLDIQVPVQAAQRVKAGDLVSLRTPGSSPVSGQVINLGAAVDKATQTVVVRARVPNPGNGHGDLSLRPGQMVEAQIATQPSALQGAGVTIPAEALLSGSGKQAQVLQDLGQGKYQTVNVDVVGKQGTAWRVTGLPANSRVVTQGTAALRALMTP